jgi:branched-chain amino acid aminotransferase
VSIIQADRRQHESARGKVRRVRNSALIKTDASKPALMSAGAGYQRSHFRRLGMNIFMVRDDVVITPPVTDNILEGITRKSVMEVLRSEIVVQVVERSIDRTEVAIADEFFMTGTAAQVMAVTKVDHRPIGTGAMGPITTKLREVYENIMRCRNPKYAHWNMAV